VIPVISPDTEISVKIPNWWKSKDVIIKFVGPGLESLQKEFKVVNGCVAIPLKYRFHVAGAVIISRK